MKKQKSPSFSFYSADFLVGTTSMTDKQVGQYIRLLCLQHQSSDGKLTKQEVMNILKKDDPIVLRKFSIDENGLYFNERLLDEIAKREEYLKSQRDKINKRWHKDNDTEDIPNEYNGNTKVIPLEIEVENDINNNKKVFIKPSLKDIEDYCNERNNKVNPISFINFYESKGWMIGKNKMKDWKAAVRTWEQKIKEVTTSDGKKEVKKPEWMDSYLADLTKMD